MKKHVAILLLAFICFWGITTSSYSASNVILKIDGITGESTVEGHEGEIDIITYSWNLSHNYSSTNGTLNVGPIIVIKYIDRASPILNYRLVTGYPFEEATLNFSKTGEYFEFLEIKMYNVRISKVSHGGMANDFRFTESVSLVFDKVCYSYTPQRPDGSGDATIKRCFNTSGD